MEIFDTNSADKIQSQNYKGDKSAASCQLGLKIFLVKIKTLPGKTSLIVIEKSYELTVPSGTQCLSISWKKIASTKANNGSYESPNSQLLRPRRKDFYNRKVLLKSELPMPLNEEHRPIYYVIRDVFLT